MTRGLVIRVDDQATGFSERNPKRGRPYLVARVIGEPPELVYVVPRTSTGSFGVLVPAGVLPGLNKDGKFLTSPIPVDAKDLEDAEEVGMLEEPYLSRVTQALDSFLMDL